MNYEIEKLTLNDGTTLINVPCEPDILKELGIKNYQEVYQREIVKIQLPILINNIDTTAATITTKWTRFSEEYAQREKAAQAFKATDYKGEPNLYITSFSTAAGITDQQAAELILSQAENLRTVQAELGALRMRKYELKQPDLSVDELQAIHDDIITKMQAIGDSHD